MFFLFKSLVYKNLVIFEEVEKSDSIVYPVCTIRSCLGEYNHPCDKRTVIDSTIFKSELLEEVQAQAVLEVL